MNLLEITCPLCKGIIWINPDTGKVVDHKAHDHKKADFNDFIKSRHNQSAKWDEKMQKAKDEKEKRRAELEEKFKQARENPESIQGEYINPLDWD